MSSALVLLGFDISHAVMTVLNFKPSHVAAVLASVNGTVDPRALLAYSSLEQLAATARLDLRKVEVEVTEVEGAVEKLQQAMVELIRLGVPLVVDVGGGMRILVVEALLALLSLPRELRDLVKLVVYLEGRGSHLELNHAELLRVLRSPRAAGAGLSYLEREILRILEESPGASLGEIHERLTRAGVATSKQNVHRVLKRLVERGHAVKLGRGIYGRPPG